MSENFKDYLVALSDDPNLLSRYKSDPVSTLKDARISKEEKFALRSGDLSKIKAELPEQELPPRVMEMIAGLPKGV